MSVILTVLFSPPIQRPFLESNVWLRRLRPRARHLTILATVLRRVVRLQDARLTLICLRKGISALLAHALHLANLADRLLELLHPVMC